MPSAKPYLDRLDATPVPELWHEIERRTTGHARRPLISDPHGPTADSTRRRLIAGVVAFLVAAAGFAFAVRAIEGGGSPTPRQPLSADTSKFDSLQVPWTMQVPNGWHVDVDRTAANPNAKTGTLATWAVNSGVHISFDGSVSTPNSTPGATKLFGRDGAVVIVELGFSPSDRSISWDPRPAPTAQSAFTSWFDDAQNPGWVYRWRRECVRSGCLQVIEWHGPAAASTQTSGANARTTSIAMNRISSSISLQPTWTDPRRTTSTVSSAYLPLRFGNVDDSWHLWDSGPVQDGTATVAWASTSPIEERDKGAGYAIPVRTIAALRPGDIVVAAEATPWGYDADKGPYPSGSLDRIDLAQANVRTGNTEEPPGNYTVYQVDGSYTLVRVYFGTSAPPASEIHAAQQELDSLEVPPVCPTPSQGGYGVDASATAAAPGDTVRLTGPMPYQQEDGSYDTDPHTAMVAWWNVDPKDWQHIGFATTSSVPPAGPGPVLRLGDGGVGECSFEIRFTVPDVPPGDYRISVLQEGPMPNPNFAALEDSLIVHVTTTSS